jgi:hypothetical protein
LQEWNQHCCHRPFIRIHFRWWLKRKIFQIWMLSTIHSLLASQTLNLF